VHLARLHNGQRVVVKVQRPGLKDLFDIDLKNIRALAVWLQKVDPKTDGAARDWVAIYDECSRILYQEIDYRCGVRIIGRNWGVLGLAWGGGWRWESDGRMGQRRGPRLSLAGIRV
jgi:hypothetical protein